MKNTLTLLLILILPGAVLAEVAANFSPLPDGKGHTETYFTNGRRLC